MRNNIIGTSMVNSVVRALYILRNLGKGMNSLTNITNSLNMNKTTTYRLLKTLESEGFVIQDTTTHQYHLGPSITHLASNPIVEHQVLIINAFDEMEYLRELSGETVALWVKHGAQRILLEELPSNHNIRYTLGRGAFLRLHYGTGGKVILSQLSEKQKLIYVNGTKLVTRANEIIDKETLLVDLKKIKELGYVITFDESIEGSGGISVPIYNYTCPAALSIFGPKYRFQEGEITNILKEIRESADRISKKMLEQEHLWASEDS